MWTEDNYTPVSLEKNDHPIDVSMSNDMITNTRSVVVVLVFW